MGPLTYTLFDLFDPRLQLEAEERDESTTDTIDIHRNIACTIAAIDRLTRQMPGADVPLEPKSVKRGRAGMSG